MTSIGKRVVLLLADEEDPHTQAIARALLDRGCQPVVADVWQPGFPLAIRSYGNATLTDTERCVGVWTRLKPRPGTLSDEETFAIRERRDGLLAYLLRASDERDRINDPWAQDRARLKPLQLEVARDLGFDIPKTCISNDVEAIAELGQLVVYKALTWLSTLEGQVLFTNVVSTAELRAHADVVRRAPGIFQEVVQKACEYRITVIDDAVFTARIDSQKKPETQLDWRRDQMALQYEAARCDPALEERVLALCRRLNLRFGAIDLIERPDGEIVFLEVNPAGNWLWIEERLSLPITTAVAAALDSKPR